MVAKKNLPADNLKDLVAWMKANPGKINFVNQNAAANVTGEPASACNEKRRKGGGLNNHDLVTRIIQLRNALNAASSLRPTRYIRYQCSPFDTDFANGATSLPAFKSSST
jgi:hypothetical protein